MNKDCSGTYYKSCIKTNICLNTKFYDSNDNKNNIFDIVGSELSRKRCILPCHIDYFISCCLNNNYIIRNIINISELQNYGHLKKINSIFYKFYFIYNNIKYKYVIIKLSLNKIKLIHNHSNHIISYLLFTDNCSNMNCNKIFTVINYP